ncbi:MAG: spiro-SPASM protein [Treponema sp.]|nr:spiro-SPASM protein [Treponema sp.]
MMKTLVILCADFRSLNIFDKCFDDKSSFDFALEWAKRFGDEISILASREDMDFVSKIPEKNITLLDDFTTKSLLGAIAQLANEKNANVILYSYADTPFLNDELTKTILEYHTNYLAEYTFAEGYPYGFAPEALDSGAAQILSNLAATIQKDEGEKRISRTSIFDLIKTDINSFEVETVLSTFDARMFRMKFDCACPAEKNACIELFECIKSLADSASSKSSDSSLHSKDADFLAKKASENPRILKTLPFYYDIQISKKSSSDCLYIPKKMQSYTSNECMRKEDFTSLLEKIEKLSDCAVINLSGFGEPLLHPDFIEFVDAVFTHANFRLLIETDGLNVTENLCEKIKAIVDNASERRGLTDYFEKILWIVKVDAVSDKIYAKIHPIDDTALVSNNFSCAVEAISILQKYFPHSVYPQFMRMNQNEEELEQFYRTWSNKSNASDGNVIIQKYSSFCKTLPDYKVADLSPLERNPCWHIRRDITILVNGNVPLCRECLDECVCGNVFTDDLLEIWHTFDDELKNHINNIYCEKCGKCDEYYTFNF